MPWDPSRLWGTHRPHLGMLSIRFSGQCYHQGREDGNSHSKPAPSSQANCRVLSSSHTHLGAGLEEIWA